MEEFRNRETLLGKDLPLNHHETLQNGQHEGHRRRCQRATHLGEGEDLACVAVLVMRGVRVRVHDLLSIHHMIVPERSATYVQIAECAQNHKGNRAKAQTVWTKGSGHQLRLESERKKLRRIVQFFVAQIYKKAVRETKRERVKETKRQKDEETKRQREEGTKSQRDKESKRRREEERKRGRD